MARRGGWRALLLGALFSGGLGCSQGEIGGFFEHEEPLEEPPEEGLIARWGFDANAGSKVADISGNQHDGEVEGESIWHPSGGVVHGALELGDESYVLFEGFGGPAEDQEMSVAMWLRSVSGSTASFPLLSTGDSGWGLYYDPAAKKVSFVEASSGLVEAEADLGTDTWRHVAAVDSREWLLLYIDGELAAFEAVETRRGGGGELQDLRLAATVDDPGAASTGLFDDVLVYDRALSWAEVESISDTQPAPAPDVGAPELAIETMTLRGQIENLSSDVSLMINGTEVTVQPDGAWEVTLDVPNGQEEIVLTVSSSAGTHAEERLQVEEGALLVASEARSASQDGQDQP